MMANQGTCRGCGSDMRRCECDENEGLRSDPALYCAIAVLRSRAEKAERFCQKIRAYCELDDAEEIICTLEDSQRELETVETRVNLLEGLLREAPEWLDEVCNPDNEEMWTEDGVDFRRRLYAEIGGGE